MSQQPQPYKPYTEADVQLALSNIKCDQIISLRRAEVVYSVPRRTIARRRAGKLSQRDSEPKLKRLTKLEEEVIIQRILDKNLRGVPPSKLHVRDIADRLLRNRSSEPVGKNWVDNFIRRTPELRTRWTRPYDYQRALCEDPAIIEPWYTLVQNMKAKYGIVDDDMYNFDESGFLMGKISSQLVVTGIEKPGKAKKL
jgi:hypothetical protein